ncbi:MAG TPA: bifunctional NAD(P)/FAD-dependent oxidoreductase/class I SAM-dependent methyltransferase [Egibacteraceae bacterium]|nr:bifunctional NAD(P)/FAD-dependent oxidoreductase/class I SAM-dependent methyltransferase [Egibacteraceae bacterium]
MGSRTAEVVVVGAGFAGLAAAQVLGRAQRDVLVLGSGPTRNAEAEHAHNVLTRDGTPPGELLRLGLAEVEALSTVSLEEADVVAVAPGDAGRLRVHVHAGTSARTSAEEIQAEIVLLATGARDTLPEVPGLAALWGRRAHSCPFCDGAAYARRRLLVLAEEVKGAHLRTMLAGWTDQVRVVDPATVGQLDEHGDEVTARLVDGEVIAADGIFVGVTPVPRVNCVAGMALARRGPYLAVDGDGRTTHPRLRAAGDCAWRAGDTMPGGQVVAAMAAGSRAAFRIVFDRLGVTPPEPPPFEMPRTAPGPEERTPAQFWDDHYGRSEQVWSGKPNQRLVDEVAGLTPGTALDLGCGEGADAVWLAEQEWRVVATDVSATALERGARAAAEHGVAGLIDWQHHDLGSSFPEGAFDLVVAAYLLSPIAIPRAAILRSAAAAIRPGGSLVILGHTALPPWADQDPTVHFASFEEELAALELDPLEWAVETAEEYERTVTSPDGATATRVDTILRIRRR